MFTLLLLRRGNGSRKYFFPIYTADDKEFRFGALRQEVANVASWELINQQIIGKNKNKISQLLSCFFLINFFRQESVNLETDATESRI
jgi:hypothetical protein